ncbi:MAG TPA: mechanosensitive ion channel [Candidatus Competibacteraceae bacterium]|nr:mechanosensitive ion channel [Candidatus Competibacteraceae bacterium]MCP5134313.1 mechanosensitive ion channel [Gammaproteobacteria bacterium]HPF58200.1 mechanosensitive ion channel [Candidatus Competibacteraceae bacterium]
MSYRNFLRNCSRPQLMLPLLWLLLLVISSGVAQAQNVLTLPPLSTDPAKATERQNTLRQALAEQQATIEHLRQEITQLDAEQRGKLQTLKGEVITAAMVEKARLDYDTLQLKQESVQADIDATQRQIKALEQSIVTLEAQEQLLRNPAKGDSLETGNRAEQLAQAHQQLEERSTGLKLEQENLKNLKEWLTLLVQRQALAGQWRARLEELYLQQQVQGRQEAQQDRATRLEREQQAQLSKAEELRIRLQRDGEKLSEAQRSFLQISIQIAEERAQRLRWDNRLAAINDGLANWESVANAQNTGPHRLQEGLRQLTALRGELREMGRLIESRLTLLGQQQQSIQFESASTSDRQLGSQTRQLLTDLEQELRQSEERLLEQSDRLERLREDLETAHTQRSRQDLLARESFVLFAPAQWPATAVELSKAPRILLHQIWLSVESALTVIATARIEQWLSLAGLILLLATLAALSRHRLARISERYAANQDDSFANKFVLTVARLLRRNLWGIALAATLTLGLWLMRVPQPGLAILLTLVLFWVSIKTPLDLAWLLLAAPDLPAKQYNLRLYQWVFWILLGGGILSALVILAHVSELPYPAIRVLDQAFLFYWLVVCYPLLRLRHLLLEGLAGRFTGRLWHGTMRLLTLLLPLVLAGAALLSLAGYLNLAWLIVWRLLILAGVLLVWLLLRSLIDELIVLLKNQAIAYSNYGLLWTQEILAPLNSTLRWVLLLIAGAILLELYSERGYLFTFWTSIAWEPVLIVIVVALLSYEGLLILVGWLVEQTQNTFGGALIRHLRQPVGLLVPVIAAQLLLPALELSGQLTSHAHHALILMNIATIGWLLVRLTSVAEDVMQQHYLININDNLGARRLRTQFQMLRRIVVLVVQVLALSVMMMTFPKIRELGAGLLASAGVAGIVIGVAARPFLENLIAGVQIGLTQPIRIEDVVIVEGEWGRIAEINATHVVVRIWDDRRLIVPLNYFNTKPFQNWTWANSELLGTAFFYVDYTFPVEAGRQELKRILDESGLWDGRAWGLQVTDTTDRTVTLRALMSAPDASSAWDLRCLVRERFVAFLQTYYPQCLPRTRFSESRYGEPDQALLALPADSSAVRDAGSSA